MKKLLVCLTLAAFATMTSLQAEDACCAAKTDTTKKETKEIKTTATATASQCCAAPKDTAKSCCAAAGKVAKKHVDVKGGQLLVGR
jgi:hypothetical protein